MKTRHHPNLRVEQWHRRLIYLMMTLLTATGLRWLLTHYALHVEGEFGPRIHPLEIWSSKMHGLATSRFLMCNHWRHKQFAAIIRCSVFLTRPPSCLIASKSSCNT